MNINQDIFTSRLFMSADPVIKEFSWNQLKWDFFNRGWWSRIYEYQWLKEVVGSYFENDINRKKVIDVATGNQHPGMFILKQSGFESVVGTDLHDLSKCIFKDSLIDGISYVKDNMLSTKVHDRFDCVVCISVLEHLHPSKQIIALETLIGYLSDKGCVVLTFDMPGFDYKADIKLYSDILKKHGFDMSHRNVDDNLVMKATNSRCPRIIGSIMRRGLSCYRIFAWR